MMNQKEAVETTQAEAGASGLARWDWAPYLAEGIGTFGLVFAGCGAIMIDALSHGQITHVGVGLVFGLIITVMIQIGACVKCWLVMRRKTERALLLKTKRQKNECDAMLALAF